MPYETPTSLLVEYHTPLQKMALYHAIQQAAANGYSEAVILEILQPPRYPAPEPSAWPHLLTNISIEDETTVRITTNSAVFPLTAKGCPSESTKGIFVRREGTTHPLFLSSPVNLKLSEDLTITLTPGLLAPTYLEILPNQFAPLTAHLQIPPTLWNTLQGRLFVGLTLSPPGVDEPADLGTLCFTATLTALNTKLSPTSNVDALSFHEQWPLTPNCLPHELNVADALERYFSHPLMDAYICQQLFSRNPLWKLLSVDLYNQSARFLDTFPVLGFDDFLKRWYDLRFFPNVENSEGEPQTPETDASGAPPLLFLSMLNEDLPVGASYGQRAVCIQNALKGAWNDQVLYNLRC